ncbi:hypothetical protein KIN20_010396 [Parelaphostrongylus tenuis]|uniref:Uncharacterized protein n=1 Tax=Parelaphostrongylus tenuis TaxID=148309 RepID=A0AAD5M7T7_PARTN|nr:hypothetical protein KIN20_010396 [Parelaphostrongylus tenuis]
MCDVYTREAAVLGLLVPSPVVSVPQQHVVKQEHIPSWDESAQLQQQYVPSTITEQPVKPSSFAPDPAEFNKPLYMHGPPQQQPLQHHQHTSLPSHTPIEHAENGDYNNKQQSYPLDEKSYPAAPRICSITGRPMKIRCDFAYDENFSSETKMYQHDTPSSYRQEDHYGNQTGPCSYDTYDTTPRFFGASPLRNLAASINRPTPGGMTMPHLVTPPQQHLTDDKRATVPAKDGSHLPPHLSLPYGIPPAQLRGAPQQPTRQARSIDNSETSPSNSLTDQERYGGPALLQKENIRKPPERPAGDNRPPPSSNGSSSWDTNMQNEIFSQFSKNDLRNNTTVAPSHRKPLLSQPPSQRLNIEPQKPVVSPSESAANRSLAPPRLSTGSSAKEPSIIRTPLLGPNFGAGPNVSRSSAGGPKYVELSRLPAEMLRPAALEQFLKPSVPLTISSVKVVYSSQGIHKNTLVRFENASDAESVMKRDGELGIRVRPSTKVAFEQAVDCLPSVIIASAEAVDNGTRKRDSEPSRRRSRSLSRERRRSRRHSPPRQRQRCRSRSRDRHGIHGSPSHSLKRSRQTTSSTRWCLQLTNVPFRCTKAEIIDWLSERVRPSKVTRTFYADGNASDRWIAEFESESLMQRAQGIKRLLMGRTVRMCHIENDHADELMKIEDVYGERRRKENNEKMLNEVSHFNSPPVRGGHGGGPVFFPAPARSVSLFGRGSHRGSPMMSARGPAHGLRGGRGMGRGFSSYSNDGGTRGRGRGAFGGRGGICARENKPTMRSSDRDSIENESHKSDLGAPKSPEPKAAYKAFHRYREILFKSIPFLFS